MSCVRWWCWRCWNNAWLLAWFSLWGGLSPKAGRSAALPQTTVVCEGHWRRLTPPSNLWLICKGSLARARALRGGYPPHPPFGAGETSCFHAPACVPARSGDWENRVNSKTSVGVITKESVFVILAGRRGSRRGVAAQIAAASPPVMIAANAADLITGLPGTSRAMTGWGTMVSRKAMSPFERTMVNNCHAKRDTKTCSGVARLFLSCALASQLAFVLSIHHYL